MRCKGKRKINSCIKYNGFVQKYPLNAAKIVFPNWPSTDDMGEELTHVQPAVRMGAESPLCDPRKLLSPC